MRAALKRAGADAGASLSFFAADLTADAGWAQAVEGRDYVLHVVSPFPPGPPKHEDELIVPAREGALRVLRAARGRRQTRRADVFVRGDRLRSSAAGGAFRRDELDRSRG